MMLLVSYYSEKKRVDLGRHYQQSTKFHFLRSTKQRVSNEQLKRKKMINWGSLVSLTSLLSTPLVSQIK